MDQHILSSITITAINWQTTVAPDNQSNIVVVVISPDEAGQ